MTSLERAWRGARNDWRLYLLGVFSVAVAFVCLSAALLVVHNVQALRARWEDTGRASVYLKAGASEDQVIAIERALRKTHGVTDVRRVTPEQARRELVSAVRDPLLESLPEAAFPASIEFGVSDRRRTEIDKLAAQLGTLGAVDAVETYQAWTDRLTRLLRGGLAATTLLALVILASVVAVVSATIRLSLQRRRIEVEVLKLVGASDGYVQKPFVVEGALQGAIGAFLAIVLLAILHGIVGSQFAVELSVLIGKSPEFLPFWMLLAMVLVGGLLGAAAAYGSLRRMLLV
jgi:cell division transport system permease protein